MRTRGRLRDAGDRAVATALFGLTKTVGLLPIDRSLAMAHAIGTRLGPLSARHRIVLANLEHAMPELEQAERESIGREMWGHQARLVLETAFFERIYDPRSGQANDRVEVRMKVDLRSLHNNRVPTILFTAHTGGFEFLPALAESEGLPMLALFRAPNNPYVAERLLRQRERSGARMIRSEPGTAQRLASELRARRAIGVLVDQKFKPGPKINFFGKPAPTNPLIARLAALTKGVIVPARCVRLPSNRYRLEVDDPITLPRNEQGWIDVDASLQVVNDITECWVREHPEQWMWFHRRWGNLPPRDG